MSIKLMSAIFETEFFDLKDEAGNVTKASTAKLILLALADHANDEGEGAYPGLTKMMRKTALTKQCVMNTYDALKHNGIIALMGKSKLATNNYTISTQSFPKTFDEGKSRLLVIPVDQGGNPSLPPQVISVDPNHPLTTTEPPIERDSDFSKVVGQLEQLCGGLTGDTARLVGVWLEKHPLPRVLQAIEVAGGAFARSPKYVDKVLISWEANGYPKTREELIAERKQYSNPPTRQETNREIVERMVSNAR